jgi:hypothetical protein
MTAIKEALAQPEQEPFAFVDERGQLRRYTRQDFNQVEYGGLQRLYTTPPKRPWVGLTPEEILAIVHYSQLDNARALEDKLRDKNT